MKLSVVVEQDGKSKTICTWDAIMFFCRNYQQAFYTFHFHVHEAAIFHVHEAAVRVWSGLTRKGIQCRDQEKKRKETRKRRQRPRKFRPIVSVRYTLRSLSIGGGWLYTKQQERNIFDKFRLGQKFRALCPVLLAEPEFRLGKNNDVIFEVLAAWNNFTP